MLHTQKIGIWLDRKEAYIIRLRGKEVKATRLLSNIEDTHPGGGSRSKVPYGPMDKSDERKLLRRKQRQMYTFFETILQEVEEAESVFLFGPGEMKTLFKNFMVDQSKWAELLSDVVTADSMTENQMIAKVKDHFGVKNSLV